MREGTPSLAGAGGQSASGQRVTRLATVGAETSFRAATTLLHRKCTFVTPGTVQIHGLGANRRGLVARRGREGEATGGRARMRLGGRLGARAGGRSLVLFDKNGRRHIGMKSGGKGTASGKLEPYGFL